MKKIINSTESFVDESLEGILLAHGDVLRGCPEDGRAIVRADAPATGKVAIVTGGGYGHLPVFLGYVGPGLADGVAVGNVFTSPSSETIVQVTREVNGGAGVLYLFGNYVGDGLNFEMAGELASIEGIETAAVKASDDVASAPRDSWQQRRGVAGIFFAYKAAGARAEQLASLQDVQRVAEKTVERTATMGVALSSCWVPGARGPIFDIGDSEIELGMGIHGEPGIARTGIQSSRELAGQMIAALADDLKLVSGSRVALVVNGLGSTTREELYILYKDAASLLQERGIAILKTYIGDYATSLEMAGASLSLLNLDDELLELLEAPAYSPFINL